MTSDKTAAIQYSSNPRLLHPLMGCNFSTLLKLLAANGFVSPRRIPNLAIILTASLLRIPFSTLERLVVRQLCHQMSPMSAPVFIVGHWRSGTTYLYNLLSRSPDFAYVTPLATGLPWDFLLLAKLLQPILEYVLPSDRFIDQVPVNPDSPQEDEIGLANMQLISFYHGLYFPRQFRKNFNAGIFLEDCDLNQIEQWKQSLSYFLTKLHLQQPDKRLLIKNPVYTSRVALLRSLFPDAKFIHIYRNPYIVFQSMRNFYHALFQELALQPIDRLEIDEVILESYPKMMNALLKDAADLPADQFVEVRFEEFERNPLQQLQHIYSSLELDNWEIAKPVFSAYLESQGSYRKNRYSFSAEANEKVWQHWQPFIEAWNYQIPN